LLTVTTRILLTGTPISQRQTVSSKALLKPPRCAAIRVSRREKELGMRVLLIEDETTIAQSIELVLTSKGFKVSATELGDEGTDLGTVYRYDIILLDCLPSALMRQIGWVEIGRISGSS
jgi:PleD family two-component response regulator